MKQYTLNEMKKIMTDNEWVPDINNRSMWTPGSYDRFSCNNFPTVEYTIDTSLVEQMQRYKNLYLNIFDEPQFGLEQKYEITRMYSVQKDDSDAGFVYICRTSLLRHIKKCILKKESEWIGGSHKNPLFGCDNIIGMKFKLVQVYALKLGDSPVITSSSTNVCPTCNGSGHV